ncbi:MAG: class I poly(R)-hydroxyalkanoic acid synthase [Rhodobacteraceae bacterium]|nr:class I poly(R)-hydroxyalkanoic acid synthase [Paracoccaceae bacterium]
MSQSEAHSDRIKSNLSRVDNLTKRLAVAMARKKQSNPNLSVPDGAVFAKAAQSYFTDLATDPSRLFAEQAKFWGESMDAWMDAQRRMFDSVSGKEADNQELDKDRRFRNELWEKSPFFRLVKEQYKINSRMVHRSLSELDGLNEGERRKIEFFVRQFVDMMSPSNFLLTNPEALERAVSTEGKSLVDGLENFVRDVEAGNGNHQVSLTDTDAFEVGGNIATTRGSIVYRNELIELIQYSPLSAKVKALPLLIIPPWINKYYILDLKQQNSFVRWTVEQGYTVFVVSWINPDGRHREVGLDDYATKGAMAAIDEVLRITGAKKLNAVGYCIGGTLLALVLAYMNRKGVKTVRSATFFATFTDFTDIGELGVFFDKNFLAGIKEEIGKKGFFPSKYMSQAFSYMRANDLVYGPAVRSYMLGEAPPAFDLLYWNGDSTNLSGKMALEYFQRLCIENQFVKGEFELCGTPISMKDIKQPLTAVACESDHLVNWETSFKGISEAGSASKNLILAQSGHIAGIINPPGRKKYGHYRLSGRFSDAESWKSEAEFEKESWWPVWAQWLGRRSGKKIDARWPGGSESPELCPAPGTYVLAKAAD